MGVLIPIGRDAKGILMPETPPPIKVPADHKPVHLPPPPPIEHRTLWRRVVAWWRREPTPLWHRVVASGIHDATAKLPRRWLRKLGRLE